MPFNGSGVFVRLYNWVSDRDNGVKILASKMDDEMDGFAAGLTSVNAHVSATGNPHGTTAANIGAAPTASPTFTGTINGVILTLSGALTAASGTFSGALTSASATISGLTTTGRIRLTGSGAGDVTLASTNNPIQIGSESGTNSVFDGNEIQFRDNGAAAGGSINGLGGDLTIGNSGSDIEVPGHLNFTAFRNGNFAGWPSLYLYTGTTTLNAGDTTTQANLQYASVIDNSGSSGGSGGGGTPPNIATGGSPPAATYVCNGYAPEGCVTHFTRIS